MWLWLTVQWTQEKSNFGNRAFLLWIVVFSERLIDNKFYLKVCLPQVPSGCWNNPVPVVLASVTNATFFCRPYNGSLGSPTQQKTSFFVFSSVPDLKSQSYPAKNSSNINWEMRQECCSESMPDPQPVSIACPQQAVSELPPWRVGNGSGGWGRGGEWVETSVCGSLDQLLHSAVSPGADAA